jgi:hypothetical protein
MLSLPVVNRAIRFNYARIIGAERLQFRAEKIFSQRYFVGCAGKHYLIRLSDTARPIGIEDDHSGHLDR